MSSKPLINNMNILKKRDASVDIQMKQRFQLNNDRQRLPLIKQAARAVQNNMQFNQSLLAPTH